MLFRTFDVFVTSPLFVSTYAVVKRKGNGAMFLSCLLLCSLLFLIIFISSYNVYAAVTRTMVRYE